MSKEFSVTLQICFSQLWIFDSILDFTALACIQSCQGLQGLIAQQPCLQAASGLGQNCGIWKFFLPGWYCIVTQRDFHTNKGHERLHSLERSMGLESIRLILHGSDSFIIGLLGLGALHWECGFGYLVYFLTLVGGDACILVATGAVPHFLSPPRPPVMHHMLQRL